MTDPYNYACAVYVCRLSDPIELTDLILTKESAKKQKRFNQGYQILLQKFYESESDLVKIHITCPIGL